MAWSLKLKTMNTKPPVVVFDLDLTLADSRHREGLAQQAKWADYVEQTAYDELIQERWDMLRKIHAKGISIIILTSRTNTPRMRELTTRWLHKHKIPFAALLMRDRHTRPYKHKLDELMRLEQIYDIKLVIDDEFTTLDICNYLNIPCKRVQTPN